VAALVQPHRTGFVTFVRSTAARERADEPLVYDADEGSTPSTASRSGSGA
jgi:hypothetical protein